MESLRFQGLGNRSVFLPAVCPSRFYYPLIEWGMKNRMVSQSRRKEGTHMHGDQGLVGDGGGTPQLPCPSTGIPELCAPHCLPQIPRGMNPRCL